MKPYRRLAAALFTAAIGAAIALQPATSAAASAPEIDRNAVVTITSTAPGTDGAGTQQVISCSIATHNPHHSSHVPGTINVVSQVTCTAPVASITGTVALFRDITTLAATGSGSNAGMAFLQMNAATSTCVSGLYDAFGSATIVFPPGFNPPSGQIGAWSNLVSLTC